RLSRSQGRKARRSSNSSTDQVPAGHQPQDSKGARPHSAGHVARARRRGDRMRRGEFISLFVGVAAAWSLAAHAQESGTLGTTKVPPAPLPPQIEVAHVKPVDRTPPNLRLSDDRIDLMSGFSLSSAQAIGGAWGIPLRPPTPFDERYGQWE